MINFSKPINEPKPKTPETPIVKGPRDDGPCWKGME